VYEAVRTQDGANVLLKQYSEDSDATQDCARAYREFQALRSLEPGIGPTALALESNDSHPVLVLELLDGHPPRSPMALRPFLCLAIRAAHALAAIHAARLVHRGLRPDKLLLHPETDELTLIGFGHTAPLGASTVASTQPERTLVEALFYMAPEQTGRLERGIDHRSDLYSLGATLYELLCGRPPFDACDPADLIHAHIAVRPRAPAELSSKVPGTLSRILMKLLEKEPEDRYQTAEALEIDLETCREQLDARGAIDDELPLGAADAPYRPLFRNRIYGRAAEQSALIDAYQRARGGSMELFLVSGVPGIGKSALVPLLRRPLAIDGGYLARGKLDLYRGHLPYAGFVSALRSLLIQLSRESDVRRAEWSQALAEGLGPLAGAIAELIPESRDFLGDLPAPPAVEPHAAQSRLALAIRRLIKTIAERSRPLVLFLDDLQWADSGSRYLLEEILDAPHEIPLLVIGSYRSNEVDAQHPLTGLIERLGSRGISVQDLELGPLGDSAICEMLGEALEHPPEEMRELATLVADKSGRIPLLIQQCVYHLHQLECIGFEPKRGWSFDLAAIEAAVLPEDPVGMMLVRLRRLRGEARAAIELASCIGDEFALEILTELSGRSRAELESALYELSDEGLIAPCQAGFRFVHDRIREAAQTLLPEAERIQLHFRMASLMLEKLGAEEQHERCFELADHIAKCLDKIPESLRLDCIRREWSAGRMALASGAFATSAHYFAIARELYRETDWEAEPELGFDLYYQASICAYRTGCFDEAIGWIDQLDGRRLTTLQSGRVAAHRLAVTAAFRSPDEVLALRSSLLAQFGDHSPSRPPWWRTWLAVHRMDWKLRGNPELWEFSPLDPEIQTTPYVLSVIRNEGTRAGVASSLGVACAAAIDSMATMLRHGYLTSPGLRIATFAVMRRAFLHTTKHVERYLKASECWLLRTPEAPGTVRGQFVVEVALRPWIAPRRGALEPLRRISEQLEELGDLQFAISALLMRANYAALAGDPLDQVLAHLESIRPRSDMTAVETPEALARPYRYLAQGDPVPEDASLLFGDPAVFAGAGQQFAVHWMVVLCVLQRFEDAWRASELIRGTIFERHSVNTHVVDYLLFRGIAACALARSATFGGRRVLRRRAAECQRALARIARFNPDFVHMDELLRAERSSNAGAVTRASHQFECAARQARERGYLHHAAFAFEEASRLQEAAGSVSEAARLRAEAAHDYDHWGARAKAEELRGR